LFLFFLKLLLCFDVLICILAVRNQYVFSAFLEVLRAAALH
jgi:hypothetical protein